ncbi:hypothetical protein TWF281_011348 [Arthrobotrys megalospora]
MSPFEAPTSTVAGESSLTAPTSAAPTVFPTLTVQYITSTGGNCTGCMFDNATYPKPSPLTVEISVQKTSPETNKKAVAPSFFYRGGRLRIRCLAARFIYGIEPRADNPLNFPLKYWPHFKEDFSSKEDAMISIDRWQTYCKEECSCSDEGRVLPRSWTKCSGQIMADRCSAVYGNTKPPLPKHLEINADLIQPEPDPETTREEYLHALNSIPYTVRNDNPNYAWRMNGIRSHALDILRWETREDQLASLADGHQRVQIDRNPFERLPPPPRNRGGRPRFYSDYFHSEIYREEWLNAPVRYEDTLSGPEPEPADKGSSWDLGRYNYDKGPPPLKRSTDDAQKA